MLQKLKTVISGKYISLSIVFIASNLLANILNYVFHFFVSHRYGPDLYGEVVSLFAHLSIIGVPSLIFSIFTIKYIGRGKSEEEQIYRYLSIKKLFRFNSLTSILVLILISISLFFIGLHDNLSTTSSIFLPLIFIASVVISYEASFMQAFQLFFALSSGVLIATTLKLIGGFTIYASNYTSLSILWIFIIIGIVIQYFVLHRYLKKHISKHEVIKPITEPLDVKTIISKLITPNNILTIATLLSITAISNMDIIFARKMLSQTDSGLYGAWVMLSKIIMYAGGPISTVTFAFLADKKNKYSEIKLLEFSSLINILAGISLMVIYMLFGEMIISSMFGLSFMPISRYITKASIFGLLYSLILNINNFFLSKDSKLILIPILFFIFQIILMPLYATSLSNIINIQVALATITILIQILSLSINKLVMEKNR